MGEKQHQVLIRLSTRDRETLHELREVLYLSTLSAVVGYICDRYRADALHIVPAISSEHLRRQDVERIERIARVAARKEAKSVLYEERFITDPTQR